MFSIRKYTAALFLIAIVVASCAVKKERIRETNSIYILDKYLVDTFSSETQGNEVRLKYCPDNTCVLFSGPISSQDELGTFALLYLYYVSTYVYLTHDLHGYGVFTDNLEKHLGDIQSKYIDVCYGEYVERVRCLVNSYLNDYSFVIRKIRIDEGLTSITEVDIEAALAKERLLNIKARRSG